MTCERCKAEVETLQNTQFRKGDKSMKVCKDCMRWRNLFVNYGLTQERHEKILKEQGYRCPLCLRRESECKRSGPGGKPGLVVDHKHGTKIVRGLLCHHCNSLIGYAMEDIMVLERAIAYLKERSIL